MAYYRTYRPQRIAELDKKTIRDQLSAFLAGTVPHALLFTGPKGTGKTSTARILAKALNCEKRTAKTFEPCNTCGNCVAITAGNHIDVYEIDAASNRGIDEIRELRDGISITPGLGSCKIYIIDEVHMLTREAFNALLKTLEEPPSHVYFILATTEEHKIPDTIRSRCTAMVFSKATNDEIIHGLKRIVIGEKLTVADDVLSVIASHADGSFRDAVKVLEQAVMEDSLTLDKITHLLGTHAGVNASFFALLQKKDANAVLSHIHTLDESGADFLSVIQNMIQTFHALLLSRYGIASAVAEEMKSITFTERELQLLLKLLSRAHQETKTWYIEALPLELALLEYCTGR